MGSEDGAAFLLSRAVVLLNRGASDAEISVSWEDFGYPAHLSAKAKATKARANRPGCRPNRDEIPFDPAKVSLIGLWKTRESAPQGVWCGTGEYTRACGKKGTEGEGVSVGTAKAGRRVGIRGKRNQKIIQKYS